MNKKILRETQRKHKETQRNELLKQMIRKEVRTYLKELQK